MPDLYREQILDLYKNPKNRGKMENPTVTFEEYNPLCGDKVSVYLQMEGDRIKEVSFQGSGCAISKASASILTDILKGKTAGEVRSLFGQMHDLVTTGKCEGGPIGKLAVFAGVHKYPARVKCAILAWHAVMAAIEGKSEPVTTESEQS